MKPTVINTYSGFIFAEGEGFEPPFPCGKRFSRPPHYRSDQLSSISKSNKFSKRCKLLHRLGIVFTLLQYNHTRLTNILPGSCLIIERSSNPSRVASACDVVNTHFSAISSMCIGSVFSKVIIVCSSGVRSKSNLV